MRLEWRGSRRGATQLGPHSRFLVLVLALASAAACARKEEATRTEAPPGSDAAGAHAAASGTEAGAASAHAAGADAPEAGAPEAGAPAESARAALAADASVAAPAPAGDAGARACGEKGQPDCPLQAWMRANATPPLRARDAAGLALAFDRMASLAPPGYPNWVSISKDAASAARAGELDAARAACRGCHDQYKAKYRKEHRLRPI